MKVDWIKIYSTKINWETIDGNLFFYWMKVDSVKIYRIKNNWIKKLFNIIWLNKEWLNIN